MNDVLATRRLGFRQRQPRSRAASLFQTEDAEAAVDALAAAMLASDNFEGDELTRRGIEDRD